MGNYVSFSGLTLLIFVNLNTIFIYSIYSKDSMSNTLGGFLEENAWILIQNTYGEKQMCPIKDISIGTILVTLQGNLPIEKLETYSISSSEYESPINIEKGLLFNTEHQIIPFTNTFIHPKQKLIAGNHILTINEIIENINDIEKEDFLKKRTIHTHISNYIKIYLPEKTFILVNGIWIQSF
jgi:hypothetical protein